MKETIYTIPINEILEKECFCPFCEMYKKLEEEAVLYAVGPAMMEPDFRAITNEKGFCQKHIGKLNAQSKALALALVFDTHLNTISEIINSDLKASGKGFFKKEEDNAGKMIERLHKVNSDCTVCSKVEHTFARYIETFIYMLKKEPDFLDRVLSRTKGFCLKHFNDIMTAGKKEMSSAEFERLMLPIAELERKRVAEMKKYIGNFIDSFDYQMAGKKMDAPSDILLQVSYLLDGEFEPLKKTLDNI